MSKQGASTTQQYSIPKPFLITAEKGGGGTLYTNANKFSRNEKESFSRHSLYTRSMWNEEQIMP